MPSPVFKEKPSVSLSFIDFCRHYHCLLLARFTLGSSSRQLWSSPELIYQLYFCLSSSLLTVACAANSVACQIYCSSDCAANFNFATSCLRYVPSVTVDSILILSSILMLSPYETKLCWPPSVLWLVKVAPHEALSPNSDRLTKIRSSDLTVKTGFSSFCSGLCALYPASVAAYMQQSALLSKIWSTKILAQY